MQQYIPIIRANVSFKRYLIRRSAFRAISSPSTSFSKSRSITTSSPFITRTKPQAILSPIFRRFASNDVEAEACASQSESSPSSEDQSSIASAISSATESASTYASNATESLTENTSAAKDTVVDTASGVAAAASLGYAPRENGREFTRSNNFGDNRRSASPVGLNGERRRPRDFGRDAAALQPSNAVYVGNLLFEITEEDLQREFGKFGKIEGVKIARDARNLSKGYVYFQRGAQKSFLNSTATKSTCDIPC
jgi:nucleolin